MKNSSNKFRRKNNKEYKKNSDFGYYSKNTNRSEKNDRFLNNSAKNKNVENLNKNNTFSSSKRRKPISKSNIEINNKARDAYQGLSNKKNFDDWIWGKHSVFETLIQERAINRIWCTTEIYSSEKFYILLKDLKSKGVLIEEVSWNRLSQLTFGASHQGIALQLACSKTISLEKLIDFFKLFIERSPHPSKFFILL